MRKILVYFKVLFNTLLFLVYAIVAVPMFILIWFMRRLIRPFVLYLKRREQPFWYRNFINNIDDFTELLIK